VALSRVLMALATHCTCSDYNPVPA
jgi:hypothetical protein